MHTHTHTPLLTHAQYPNTQTMPVTRRNQYKNKSKNVAAESSTVLAEVASLKRYYTKIINSQSRDIETRDAIIFKYIMAEHATVAVDTHDTVVVRDNSAQTIAELQLQVKTQAELIVANKTQLCVLSTENCILRERCTILEEEGDSRTLVEKERDSKMSVVGV